MRDIVVYGAGGHARVIIDIIEKSQEFNLVGLVDDSGTVESIMGYPVADNIDCYLQKGVSAGLVAVGDNWQRLRLKKGILSKFPEFRFVTAIHPSATIGRNALIGEGTVVMAGCNINPYAKIDEQCIINTGCNVDHDCRLESYMSLAPGVTLGGNVKIGEFTAVGLGASVIHNVSIGRHSVIGAGAVLIKDIGSQCVAFGNPCKKVRVREIGEPYL